MTIWYSQAASRLRSAVQPSFVAYGAVSVATLCIELTVLHVSLALPQALAVSCGYLSASFFQFCVLRYAVFKAHHKSAFMQVYAYIIAAVLSWWAVVGAVALLTTLFPLSTMEARIISIPALFPLNYLVSKHFIFRR